MLTIDGPLETWSDRRPGAAPANSLLHVCVVNVRRTPVDAVIAALAVLPENGADVPCE